MTIFKMALLDIREPLYFVKMYIKYQFDTLHGFQNITFGPAYYYIHPSDTVYNQKFLVLYTNLYTYMQKTHIHVIYVLCVNICNYLINV